MPTYLAVASGISRGIGPAAELARGLSLALILAEPVLGAHPEQPLASSWVRLAVQNPPLRPVAAQPTLSAFSRMVLWPGPLPGQPRGPQAADLRQPPPGRAGGPASAGRRAGWAGWSTP